MGLTSKKKRGLRAEGNRLKPEVWIGKEGLTNGIVQTTANSLNTKELVKIKLLETCPVDKNEAAEKLAQQTGAEVVQVLGNTILLFRELPEENK